MSEVTKISGPVHGYKVFYSNWTCRPAGAKPKQYTCPGKFEEEGEIEICGHGMHFCTRLLDCFNYYSFNPENKVAEVVAYGDIKTNGEKSCTNKLEIVRELSWEEVLQTVNTGLGNSGIGNSGDCNKGNCNTGDQNSGNRNSGDRNLGYKNTGCENYGNRNTGDNNIGDSNVGDNNKGDRNVGDWNYSSFNFGCFNTDKEATMMFFNKPSDWTPLDWFVSRARSLLCDISLITLDVKDNHYDYYESVVARQNWWNNLSEEDKNVIKELPNFDPEIFYKCTDIKVD
jgi:hypothetical protein